MGENSLQASSAEISKGSGNAADIEKMDGSEAGKCVWPGAWWQELKTGRRQSTRGSCLGKLKKLADL